MGRYLKNTELKSGSYSIRLPMGYSSVGPNAPVPGLIRYNKNTIAPEIFIKTASEVTGAWRTLVTRVGSAIVGKYTFLGTGAQVIFGPMKSNYRKGDENYLLVYVGNVFQNPGVAFTVDGSQITFTSVPPLGQTIIILHGYAA